MLARRCVVHGVRRCQYRRVRPGSGINCPGQRQLNERFACLKGRIREALANAHINTWLSTPSNTPRRLHTDFPILINTLEAIVVADFPEVHRAVSVDQQQPRRCWARPERGDCQYRPGNGRVPCNLHGPSELRLSCLLSRLRYTVRELFNLGTGHRVRVAVALFRARLHKLLQIPPKPAAKPVAILQQRAAPIPPVPPSAQVDRPSMRRPPSCYDPARLRDMGQRELDSLGLNKMINAYVLDGYIALLQLHFYPDPYQPTNLNLCYQHTIDRVLAIEDQQPVAVKRIYNAPVMFGPGKVTCLPVNLQNQHWCLYIVDERGSAPRVLLADSGTPSSKRKPPTHLNAFLHAQVIGWDGSVVPAHAVPQYQNRPEQNNCGLHVLQNMEFVARSVLSTQPIRIDRLQSLFEADPAWLANGGRKMGAKRQALKNLIHRLQLCRRDDNGLQRILLTTQPFMYP